MGANSRIEWTDHTFNPWRGCAHAELPGGGEHPGCRHCYAETMARRFPDRLGEWGAGGTRIVAPPAMWREPLAWNRKAEAAGVRQRVFCASIADVFEDWQGPLIANVDGPVFLGKSRRASTGPDDRLTLDELRSDLFRLIDATPWLDWLLVTKRPQNVRRMLAPWLRYRMGAGLESPDEAWRQGLPLKNVWLLTSVSNQETFDALVPALLECRDLVPVLGISAEPLLGPIDLREHLRSKRGFFANVESLECGGKTYPKLPGLDWVIVGGESGPQARPMHLKWLDSIRDQCQAAGVPLFFKQWGEWHTGAGIPEPHKFRNGFVCPAGCFYPEITQPALEDHARNCPESRFGRAFTPLSIYRVGKAAAGRELDGRTWDEYPEPVGQVAAGGNR